MEVILSMKARNGKAREMAVKAFREHGGLLKTANALEMGIHPRTLYSMRDKGDIEQLGRGLYRLTDLPPLGNPDLVPVMAKVPQGVVCLISALAYHEITTQIPREVHIAIARNSEPPRIDYPPLRCYRFTGEAFTEGIQIHKLDGVQVNIFSPEKTLTDCFKFRNKIGMDTVLEALRLYRERKQVQVGEIMRFAKICRVAKVMAPYLESML
jgi:predicted transcriptional regulator of viral defense system